MTATDRAREIERIDREIDRLFVEIDRLRIDRLWLALADQAERRTV